uniref:BPI2 domain-containing protein n=1 Tax=Angiostrongylus cantonensis TaxID=6313 RepID=A0A0K0DNJ7_ANGCA
IISGLDVNDPGRSLGSVVARLGGQPLDEKQALSLKVTLRDSDLYFLENPHVDNSFAIVMNTTAVLNVNEIGGVITINLEVQVDFSGMIGRLSYNDVRVFCSVAGGYVRNFIENRDTSMIPVIGTVPSPRSIEISHIIFKAERADFWLLDDFQGSSIPILRISLLNLRIDHHSADRLVSSFSISADYFNQRIFGWEPFVEKWSVLRFLVTRKGNTRNLDLVAAVEDIQLARNAQRKTSVRWISVAKDMELTFEFPPRLLLYTHFERESSHQLIVRVNGWDEISPVNVDSCGTYFRLVKAAKVT